MTGWTDEARRAALAARRARAKLQPGTPKAIRKFTVSAAIQAHRNKLWKKSLANSRMDAQVHLRRPKWAMNAIQRRKR